MRTAKTSTEFGFHHWDTLRLNKALKRAADKRTFQRVQALLLVARGRSVSEVAEISGVHVQTVYNWIHLYLETQQPGTLADTPRSGRPPAAKPVTAARIERELRRNPLRLSYQTTVWTVPLLAEHLSHLYRCEMSPHTLRRRMRAMGLRCKRPRYFYEEKSRSKSEDFPFRLSKVTSQAQEIRDAWR
jgi:transposase